MLRNNPGTIKATAGTVGPLFTMKQVLHHHLLRMCKKEAHAPKLTPLTTWTKQMPSEERFYGQTRKRLNYLAIVIRDMFEGVTIFKPREHCACCQAWR